MKSAALELIKVERVLHDGVMCMICCSLIEHMTRFLEFCCVACGIKDVHGERLYHARQLFFVMEFFAEGLELIFFFYFDCHQFIFCFSSCANKFIELDVQRFTFADLCALNNEHHKRGINCCDGVDNEQPCIINAIEETDKEPQ